MNFRSLGLAVLVLVMAIAGFVYVSWTQVMTPDHLGNHASMTGSWEPDGERLRAVPENRRDSFRLSVLRTITIGEGQSHSQEVSVQFVWTDGTKWLTNARTELLDDYLVINSTDPEGIVTQLTITGQASQLTIDDGAIAYQLKRSPP